MGTNEGQFAFVLHPETQSGGFRLLSQKFPWLQGKVGSKQFGGLQVLVFESQIDE